jgi:hypothetical protein
MMVFYAGAAGALRPFAALLTLALLFAPAAVAQPAALPVAAELRPGSVALVTWPAVPGAYLACAILVRPREDRLIGCAEPGASQLRQGPGSVDGAHRLEAGDLVEVRVWDVEGVEVARGRARVAWRQWLPIVASAAAPRPALAGTKKPPFSR